MENKKVGSGTLLMLIFMVILFFIGKTAFETATMLHSLAIERVAIQQQRHGILSLTNCAIAHSKALDESIKKQLLYEYSYNNWPQSTSHYSGKIDIKPQPTETVKKTGKAQWYEITAKLLKEGKKVTQSSCVLWKDENGWRIANASV